MSWQCVLVAKETHPGVQQEEQHQQLRQVILPLSSALLRPHLKYFVQLQVPQCKRHMEFLEQVQQGISKMINGVEHLSYEERLRELGTFSQEKRWVRGDLNPVSVCRELSPLYLGEQTKTKDNLE